MPMKFDRVILQHRTASIICRSSASLLRESLRGGELSAMRWLLSPLCTMTPGVVAMGPGNASFVEHAVEEWALVQKLLRATLSMGSIGVLPCGERVLVL